MRVGLPICISLSLIITSYAGAVTDPNLVGWWTFNNGTAIDSSQYGHNGILQNGARVVYDSVRGMVLHNPSSDFNYPSGGHSGHVYCGGEKKAGDPNTWADIPRSYTILFWVKSQTDPLPWANNFEKEWQALFTKGKRGDGQLIVTTVGIAGRIYFRARGLQPTESDHIYGSTYVDNGDWHHVAAVCDYDGSSGQTTLHLYIDGSEEYNSPVSCTGSLVLSNAPVYIAGSFGDPTKDGEVYMDDVRLYNRALGLEEIIAVKDEAIPADLSGDSYCNFEDFSVLAAGWMEKDYTINSDTGGMVAHWNFAGPAGSTTVTDSISGKAATIVGGGALDGNGAAVLSGGVNGPYIDLGQDIGQVIAGLRDYTIVIDCNWNGNAAGKWQRLASFGQGTAEYAMFTYVSVNENYLRYIYRHAGHDETTQYSNYSIPTVKGRHLIALTFTKDYDQYGCSQIYIDALQRCFHTQSVPTGSIGVTTRNFIGRGAYVCNPSDPNYADPNIDSRFSGKIYDVRIYNRRLSVSDVNDVYRGVSNPLYFPLEAPGNFSDDEPVNQKVINFKDLWQLASNWLKEIPYLRE